MKNLLFLFLALFLTGVAHAQLTGIKTIKATGGTYATFTLAINALNTSGVGAGGVTFNVDAGFVSIENCPIITATGTLANPIVFQRSGNGANPLIKPTGTAGTADAGIVIKGGDYITFDGIDVSINSGSAVEYGYYIINTTTTNGAQRNTIKNCTITLNRSNVNSRGVYQFVTPNPTSAAGANSYNTYDNIFVRNSTGGIYLKGFNTNSDLSCVVKNCIIGATSANDIASIGISVSASTGINVFNNEIRNITGTAGSVIGMYFELIKGTANNVFNNKIHDIYCNSGSYSALSCGIQIKSTTGIVFNVYNNLVFALQHASLAQPGTQVVQGMNFSGTGTGNFYFNSIRIETDANTSSACFNNAGAVVMQNNIFANFSPADISAVESKFCVYDASYGSTFDNNDYYITGGTNNYLAYSSANYTTLYDWQMATGTNASSVVADPQFNSATNLFPSNTALAAGTPIAGITNDFAGITRNATTPTIGAYEYTLLTWNGSADSDWNTATNWTPNAIPSETTNVSIPDVTNDPVINQSVTSPAQCNNITIQTGAVLTINAGKALTVSGTLTNNAGTAGLVVRSGGSLIQHSADVSATVELALPASASGEWHLISSPVANSTAEMFLGKYMQTYPEPNPLHTYDDVTIPLTPLTAMKGFALWGDAAGYSASFTGPLNTGIQSNNTLTRSGTGTAWGWNLVGNPYPSYIDWLSVGMVKGNLNNATYFHVDKDNWAAYNGGVGTLTASQYIAPGQGFFVQVTDGSAAGSLNMDNTVKVHATAPFYKSSVNNLLRLQVSGNDNIDETVIRFLPDATTAYDGNYDAYKLFGDDANAVQIYSVSGDELAINALPETTNVQVGMRAGTSGIYTIAATEIKDFSEVALEDTKTGVFTDLLNNSYSFSFVPGENEQRFILHFGPLSVNETESPVAGIYSNQGIVYVELKDNAKSSIYIYTITGQLVAKASANQGINKINLANTGNYIVKVVTDKNSMVKKVFVQ
ncbi:MAG: T9SS type A sorting domain-containing protein [Bacteroidota bacterium]